MFPLRFLFLLLFAGTAPDPQTAGLQALEHGDYQQAEQLLSQAVAADSKNYFALFNLALAETSLNKDEAAADHYRQVLALKPDLYEANFNLGMLELRDHHPEDAATALRAAAKAKPDQARPQRYLGEALFATGDTAGASDAFAQAVRLDPKSGPAELGLARTLERQGKVEDALLHYQKAAELDPQLKSYLLEEAVALIDAKHSDNAIPLLHQFPDDPGAREQLGRIYLEANRPADAVPEFDAAVKLSPTPANKLALATAYLRNNQGQLAEPILQEALQSNPNDFDLRMSIGKIRLEKRDYTAAANEFIAAARTKPDAVEAWNNAASALILSEQYPQAMAALDQVRKLGKEKPADFYWRAVVLDKMHQIKPALENYQRFLAVSTGQFPDQEFIARQRSRILEREANRR